MTLNSLYNFTPFGKELYIDLSAHLVFSLYYVYFLVLVDFQFRFEGKSLVLITPVPDHYCFFSYCQTLLQLYLFIYLINSVFVVLCLESFGASMVYFHNWFLSKVTGN